MFPRRIFFIEDFDGGSLGISLAVGIATVLVLPVAFWSAPALAQQSTQDLAAAAQNPVAAVYSLPFQNNTYFGAGPNHNATANALNLQPVLPFTFGDLNIISRTIAPLIYLPGFSTDTSDITSETLSRSHFGLGDISQSFLFGPANYSEARMKTVSFQQGGLTGTTLMCPCHGSQFNVASGAVVRGTAKQPLPT